MNRKMLGGILLVLGILLIVAGVVVMAVVVPGMKQFPDDVDTTRTYTGEMPVVLNPATFEFMTGLTIELTRHFKTEEVDGDLALVSEEQILSTQGQPLQQIVKNHVIDRKTMEAVSDYPEKWAGKEGLWPREGLALGWPIDTEEKDYTGWSDDLRTTITFKYEGKQDKGGIETYYFTTSSGPQPIDPAHVAVLGLPLELPKEQFQALVAGADVPAPIKMAIPLLMNAIEGDTVPLQYYYEYTGEYWIEPTSGVIIDTKKFEKRQAGLPDEILANVPQLAALPEEQRAAARVTVSEFTYWGLDETIADAKKDAEDAKDTIQLYGTTLPIAAIVAGLLLGLVGLFLFTRKSA